MQRLLLRYTQALIKAALRTRWPRALQHHEHDDYFAGCLVGAADDRGLRGSSHIGGKAYVCNVMGIQSVHGLRPAPPLSGTVMRSQIRVAPRTTGNASEYALSRQAQELALEQAR